MELDALIGEICTRVQQRMQELEGGADGDKEAPKTCGASQDPAAAAEDKPGLLILTQEHGTLCHPALESSELKECFLPEKLYSRGKRGIFQIELSILMLDIKKITARLRAEAKKAA